MAPNKRLPTELDSLYIHHEIDTAKTEADNTLMDIDKAVREAVRDSEPCELDARAGAFITRLANIETIKRLAAANEPLPELVAYELLDELGRGGMGTVYRAKHRQLGKIQALKIIRGPSKLSPEVRARFRREVQAVGALKHPNIIAAHDADFEGDVPYLVMDYVEGESLAEIQKRLKSEGKTVGVAAACELVRQAAVGIQYAHDQKIIHRDLKPGNLMLDAEGVVRILDLGLARLGTIEDAALQEATELTLGGQILGTPDFMSPEQLQSSREVDTRTDVYALGMTLFSLLVGKPAYRGQSGESFVAKAARILHEPVPNLGKLLPGLPRPLTDIIQRCLAKSPDERLQSAGELANTLSKWASPDAVKALLPSSIPSPVQPLQTQVGHSDTQPSRSKLPPCILIGLAAVIMFPLLILAGVLLTLKLPGGGELIVECDDSQAKIQVVAVKDGQREALSLTQEAGNKFRLSEGRWTILIEGIDAGEFTLSENEVVINGGTQAAIRVMRRDAPQVASSNAELSPSAVRNNNVSATPQSDQLSNVASKSDRELPETVVDWPQLRTATQFAGLVAAPEKDSELWQWQLRPWLPQLTQSSHGLTENRIALDPMGKYFAVLSQYDCKIMELSTGTVSHTIPCPDRTRWCCVSLTAGSERIALLSESGGFVEIRDLRNRIIAQWPASQLIDGTTNHGALAWINDGQELVLWDARKASVVDVLGKVQTSIEFDPGTAPAQGPPNLPMPVQRAVESEPKGERVAFGCVDGNIRLWDAQTNTLQTLRSEQNNEPISSLHWSPDGRFLAALRAQQWINGVSLDIWNADGTLHTAIPAEQINADHQYASEFAWSPDSRSLVFGSGKVVDTQGKLQREFDLRVEPVGEKRRITSVWVPAWSDQGGSQRVDFVATGDTYGLQCGRVQSFTPTGRALPRSSFGNLLQPQALSWIEETGELAAVFGYLDRSELRTWTSDGQPKSTVAVPKFVTGMINAHSGNLLRNSGPTFSLFDRRGKLLGTHEFGEEFELGQWQWDYAGDRTAYFGKAGEAGVVRLLNNAGDNTVELHLPDEVSSNGFHTSSGTLYWSPDDKYLAMSLLMHDETHRVFVWEAKGNGKLPFVTLELADAQTPRLAWSPDSQWLATAPGGVDTQNGTQLSFLHAASQQVNEITIKHNYYPTWFASEWFDEHSVRVGGLAMEMPTEPDGEIQVRDLGFTLQHAQAAINMKTAGDVLLVASSEQGQTFEIWQGGALKSSTPVGAISASDIRKNSAGTKAVFRAGNPHDSFVQVDLLTGAIDYIGLAFDDGSSVALSSDGKLQNASPASDAYLSHVLRYPGGFEVTVSRSEYEKRKEADAPNTALQWVLDIGGLIQVEGTEKWLTQRDVTDAASAMNPTQIVGIDLSGCLLTDELLAQLVHFENLQILDLSNTPLKSLEFMPELPDLTSLALRRSQLTSLSTLRNVDSLHHLDLSHSPIDSSVGTTLVFAGNLQSLNLANTSVDRFLLDDLAELPQLRKVNVRQTKISLEEIESFSKTHPAITVD
ncbi:MAG: protein kinase [Planctomycetales bacterium]|nr:protein kinase [Planctomycetales bacterium]